MTSFEINAEHNQQFHDQQDLLLIYPTEMVSKTNIYFYFNTNTAGRSMAVSSTRPPSK